MYKITPGEGIGSPNNPQHAYNYYTNCDKKEIKVQSMA